MAASLYGILLKIAAVTLLTVMMALIKATADEVPTGQQVFFRAFFALLVIVAWLTWDGKFPKGLKTDRIWVHFTRSSVGGVAMALRFSALGILAFPDVVALSFTTPLILTVLAAVMLGEVVRAFRITTVCIGFVGVLVVLWPTLSFVEGAAMDGIGVALILGSASLAALAQVYVRRLVDTESTAQIVFYLSLFITLLSLFSIPFGWVVPTPGSFFMLASAGIVGGLGQICLTSCYRFAPASVVAPFDYTSMLLAIFIGIVWFAEIPTIWTIVGAAVIIGSGAVIVWRERQLAKEKGPKRAP